MKRDEGRTANIGTVGAFKAGSRNNELTKIAGSLRFRGLAETVIAGALQAINAAACSPPLDADEVERIASSVAKYEAAHEEAFGCLEDVKESAPEYTMYPYIVKGTLTVLDGNMGQGKSTFTCALASAVTTGKGGLSWATDHARIGCVFGKAHGHVAAGLRMDVPLSGKR